MPDRPPATAGLILERQIERDLLEEALQVNEAASGPIPQSLRDEAAELFRHVKSAPGLHDECGWRAHGAG